MLAGHDIIVQSQTGSGKTAAYAIPLCEQLDWEENKPQALILVPTRELVMQVKEDIFNIGRFKRIKVEGLFGKMSYDNQKRNLKQKTHVVVGTPGRVMDHILQGSLDVGAVKTLILDEADEMFNMGFIDQVEAIIDQLPEERQTLLLSATMPDAVKKLAQSVTNHPQMLTIKAESAVMDRIEQVAYQVQSGEKTRRLKDLLVIEHPATCIVFCNTKQQVNELYDALSEDDSAICRIHGDLDQKVRTQVMSDFKHGYYRILVASDVAARGLDIDDVDLVVNYDIPFEGELYTHRIGRSGRVAKRGKAITFFSSYEQKYLDAIEATIQHTIEIKSLPTYAEVEARRKRNVTHAPVIKSDKGLGFSEEIMKLHINAGKKTKMRPGDIVGAICSIPGVEAQDIGVLSIVDVSSFVEILNQKGEMVYQALQTLPIKGRIRKVNKANETTYQMDYRKRGSHD